MRPVTFALVGCGNISGTQARALATLAPDAQLVACVDLDSAAAARFAAEFHIPARTWEEVLADLAIDAVSLCTPSGHHGALAAAALRAGKHVLAEKPMEVDVPRCDAILAAHRDSDRLLGIISQHRFDPASLTARALLDRGDLGRIHLVDARIPWYRTQEYYDSGDWRGTWALDGGGCLMNQGVHTVDLMLWLAGPVTTVYAQARTAAHARIEVEDNVCVTVTFASGAIGTVVASTACYPGYPARLALHGTAGSLILEGDELAQVALQGQPVQHGAAATAHALQVATGGTRSAEANATAANATAAAATTGWRWGDAHAAQLADFAAAIRDHRLPAVTGEDGRRAVAFIHAVYASARSGAPVNL